MQGRDEAKAKEHGPRPKSNSENLALRPKMKSEIVMKTAESDGV